MARFIPGLLLARKFHGDVVHPILLREFPRLRFDAALVGAGSEVLGYDDRRSADHDWGPRMQIFLPERDRRLTGPMIRMLARRLPPAFLGWPVRWGSSDGGRVRHHVEVRTLRSWTVEYLGVDATGRLTVRDWLGLSSQRLRGITTGAVFHSGLGELHRIRTSLRWYPTDVWKYLLACQWNRIGQLEPFIGRTGEVGDDAGSRIIAAGLVRDVMRLACLMERTHAPYPKWFGTGFARLKLAGRLAPILRAVIAARTWSQRERAFGVACSICAVAHNRLRLGSRVGTRVSTFHGRPFFVIHSDRIAGSILRTIRDPAVKAIRSLAGSIDQISDSTDVSDFPELSHRVAATIR